MAFQMNKQREQHMEGGAQNQGQGAKHPNIHIHSHAKGHTVHIMHHDGAHEKHEHEHGDAEGIASHIHQHIGGGLGGDDQHPEEQEAADGFSGNVY